ncbi:hypothetical protein HMPREF0662_02588, partial [Prevotella nigrescens F0103]
MVVHYFELMPIATLNLSNLT